MGPQIFEDIIGEFLPSSIKDKTFQSIKHWKIMKDVNVLDYTNTKMLKFQKWNRKIFKINIIKSYILHT